MGKFYRGRNEGWSKKVDIAILYQMGVAIATIKKLLGEDVESPMRELLAKLELCLAVAQGKVESVDLAAHSIRRRSSSES